MSEESNESAPQEQPAAQPEQPAPSFEEGIELSEGRTGLVVMPEMSLSPADVQDAAGGLPAPAEQQAPSGSADQPAADPAPSSDPPPPAQPSGE